MRAPAPVVLPLPRPAPRKWLFWLESAVSTFVLIPGAGGSTWVWSRLTPLLVAAGHDSIAVELPGDDETAGLPRYTELVVDAIGSHPEVVLVAGSLGGFTAPLVCERVPVLELVLINAMIPNPGETARDWWAHTGAFAARDEAARSGGYGPFDEATYFSMMSTTKSQPRAMCIGAPRPTSPSRQSVTSRRGRQSGFVFWPAEMTASSRSACSAESLLTASASR